MTPITSKEYGYHFCRDYYIGPHPQATSYKPLPKHHSLCKPNSGPRSKDIKIHPSLAVKAMSNSIPTKPTTGTALPSYAKATSAERPKEPEIKEQSISKPESKHAPSAVDKQYAEALAKPVSSYERKTKGIHTAMKNIYDGRYSFEETAEYHDCTVEELGTMFAVFGMQAMEIGKQRGVVSTDGKRSGLSILMIC